MEKDTLKEIAFTKAKLPFGWLGNMAPYTIVYEELSWPSTEALFQALRFRPESPIREEIRTAKNGYEAKKVAKSYGVGAMYIKPCTEEDLDNMRMCIELKMDQHTHLRRLLKESGDIPIYEDVTHRNNQNSNDLFWGAKKLDDGTWEGENVMGRLWMELRMELNTIDLEISTIRHIGGKTRLSASRTRNDLLTLDEIEGKYIFYKDVRYKITQIEEMLNPMDSPILNDMFNMIVEEAKEPFEKDEIEIERRFLLAKIPPITWDKTIHIEQAYLSLIDSDKVERIRRTTVYNDMADNDVDYMRENFYHTTKERLTDMSVVEDEKEITEENYLGLWSKKDRILIKDRHIKEEGDLKWEIDDLNRLIIAEIELPSEDYDLDIPEWLEPYILLEITGMHQFSNSNLADIWRINPKGS